MYHITQSEFYIVVLLLIIGFIIFLIVYGKKIAKILQSQNREDDALVEMDDIILYLEFIEKQKPKSKSKSKSKDKDEDEKSEKNAIEEAKAKEKAQVYFMAAKTLGFIRRYEITNLISAEIFLSEIPVNDDEHKIACLISKVLVIANINKELKCPFDSSFTTIIESLD